MIHCGVYTGPSVYKLKYNVDLIKERCLGILMCDVFLCYSFSLQAKVRRSTIKNIMISFSML